MDRKDIHNNVKTVPSHNPAAISTNTTTNGAIIDSQGFGALEFLAQAATITDGAYAFNIQEGDDPALSDAVTVPAAGILGSLTGFIATDDNACKRVGVTIGEKRYYRLQIISTGVTTGGTFAAQALLGNSDFMPVP